MMHGAPASGSCRTGTTAPAGSRTKERLIAVEVFRCSYTPHKHTHTHTPSSPSLTPALTPSLCACSMFLHWVQNTELQLITLLTLSGNMGGGGGRVSRDRRHDTRA